MLENDNEHGSSISDNSDVNFNDDSERNDGHSVSEQHPMVLSAAAEAENAVIEGIDMSEFQEIGSFDPQKQAHEDKAARYLESVKEIERRKKTAEECFRSSSSSSNSINTASNDTETDSSTKIIDSNLSYKPLAPLDVSVMKSVHGYKYALIVKSHRFLNPKSKKAAFQILGLFRDDNEIRDYVSELEDNRMFEYSRDGSSKVCRLGDIHKLELFKYTLIAKNHDRERDASYVLSKIEEIKKLHLDFMEESRKEFMRNREEKTPGKAGLSLELKIQKAEEKRKKKSREKLLNKKFEEGSTAANAADTAANAADTISVNSNSGRVPKIPRNLEQRNQLYAVIIVLLDITQNVMKGLDDAEPIVMIMDSFDDEKNAQQYMENMKNYVFFTSMYVVDMYQFLHPHILASKEAAEKIEESFRDSEQELVMKTKKDQDKELAEYKQKASNAGYDVNNNAITIDNVSTTASETSAATASTTASASATSSVSSSSAASTTAEETQSDKPNHTMPDFSNTFITLTPLEPYTEEELKNIKENEILCTDGIRK